ncbi:MAG: FecR domain-containing protein [Verrucomicrobia bacterium]|nr:FecR domain-containing protein [Verrucomicrobiota bacterium]
MKQHLRFLPALLACGAMAFGVTAVAATGSARIDSVRAGSARYSTDGASWVDAKAGAQLAPGTVIRTDSLGVVDLYLGKNGPYVRVTPDTEMTLKTLDIQGGAGETIVTTELGLKSGKLQGEVRKMSAASRYEIMTPVGTVGVRGTKYQVSARGGVLVRGRSGLHQLCGPRCHRPDGLRGARWLHLRAQPQQQSRGRDRDPAERVRGDRGSHPPVWRCRGRDHRYDRPERVRARSFLGGVCEAFRFAG